MIDPKSICMINCSNPINLTLESDVYVDFREGASSYFAGNKLLKEVRSWHSLPATLETEYFIYGKDKWQGVFKYDNVVILVNRDLDKIIPFLEKLKLMKKKIVLGYHEGVSDLLREPQKILQLKQLVEKYADAYYNVIFSYNSFFKGFINKPIFSFPHGSPVDEWKHSFKKEKREGILVGTRSLRNDFLTRNTFVALSLICSNFPEVKKTYLNEDGKSAEQYIRQFGWENLDIVTGPLKYEEWLELISRHELMAHFDTTLNLGQICVDGMMVGVPAIGSISGNAELMTAAESNPDFFISAVSGWMRQKDSVNDFYLNRLKEEVSFSKLKENILNMFKGI